LRSLPQKLGLTSEKKSSIQIGNVEILSEHLFLGVGILGGIGSGKMPAATIPLLHKLLHLYKEPTGKTPKIGGLILDPKGDLLPFLVNTFLEIGRPLSDIVLLGPGHDISYNILDDVPTENAVKLTEIHKILGGAETSPEETHRTIEAFLILLEQTLPEKPTPADLYTVTKDEEKANELCRQVESLLEADRTAQKISEFQTERLKNAIATIQKEWLMQGKPKPNISQMLRTLSTQPELKAQFCTPQKTTLFKDIINAGKLVVYHENSPTPTSVTRFLCRSLIHDLQRWTKRRLGTTGVTYRLDKSRPVLFLADDCQNLLHLDIEGDNVFAGITRACRVIQIFSAPSLSTLRHMGPTQHFETLKQNVGNWIIFRSTDKDTLDLAEFLGHVDAKTLQTITPEKSKNGPWYSEALVWNFDGTSGSASTQKLPFFFLNRTESQEQEKNFQAFMACLHSRRLSQKLLPKLSLEPEEKELLHNTELARQEILHILPELSLPLHDPNVPAYRMLDPQKPTTPYNNTLSPEQTLQWAIDNPHPATYSRIREKIVMGNLPPKLRDHLVNLKNNELQKVFQNIQQIAQEKKHLRLGELHH
jgi:hypothetical protein